LQAQIAIKRVILEKQPFKTVFTIAVDTTSKKPENRIRKMAIGARMGLRIVHLPEQVKLPGFWLCLKYSGPLFKQILQVFSIEQWVIYT